MKCSLCGLEFDEKQAQNVCSGCMFSKSCELARCPNCGYEMPIEPGFIKKLRERFKKEK